MLPTLSLPQIGLAALVVVAATAAAATNTVTGDALVGIYGTVLGYVFGHSAGVAGEKAAQND